VSRKCVLLRDFAGCGRKPESHDDHEGEDAQPFFHGVLLVYVRLDKADEMKALRQQDVAGTRTVYSFAPSAAIISACK
jgi:hypothetical protein